MPRLPITDLSTDAIKAFLGLPADPITIGDICDSDRVRGEYFDINYLTGIAGAAHSLYFGLSGDPVPPATIRECVRLNPHNPSNFRNYGFDVTGYSIIAFPGEHNDNKILKYNNDEYWNDFYSAPIRDMRTAVRAPDGLLWVGGQVSIFIYENERGLFSFNGSTWRRYTTPEITGQYVYAIELGTAPYMWVGTEHGFSVFNRTTNLFTHYYIGAGTVPTGKLGSNVITSFAYDSVNGSMWVGTLNGLTHITDIDDPSGWVRLTTTDGLADNNVKCLMVGPDSDCWAGFDGHGISRITESGGTYSFDNINTGSVPGLTTNHIRKIAIDPDTYYVWAATNEGIQYFHWNMACNDVIVLQVADGLPSDEVYTVRRDSYNRKWFGFDDHIGMLVDVADEIKVWGQWHGSDELHIHEFLVDYEPVQVINEVVIGNQTWMSDNWRGNKRFMFPSGEKSKVYNYNEYNREYYGGLFTWNQVNSPGFCPSGWHIPSFAEWWELITYLGGTTAAGNALKARSFGWISHLPTVTNSTGFNATGSGYANAVGYNDMLEMTQFWTSDENDLDPTHGITIGFYYDRQDAYIEAHDKGTYWFPVRLIKNIGPEAPVALPATDVTFTTFTANWESVADILGYKLDVATDANFTSFVPGFEDLDVGDVLSYPVTGLEEGHTYYYRIRAYDATTESDNSNVIETEMLTIYTCCVTNGPHFNPEPTEGSMFLTVGVLELTIGTIGDYVIEWRDGAVDGAIVFTSGETADPGEVQAQHPLTDEVVFAGTLYPTIKYIYIDGVKYTSVYEVGTNYSPDLIPCLDPIIIEAIECETILGTDPLYNYALTYTNTVDLADDKSRKLKYNICGPDMKYLAVEFQAYTVSEQLKVYYCTLLDSSGTLIDNYIHGSRGVGGATLTQDLYPASYPTNPRIALFGQTGTSPLCFIVDISGFTYVAGDYLRIEITGGIYEPENSNTNWYIKLQSLDAVAELFIADTDLYKIADTPVMNYLSDPDCRYEISYNTVDGGTSPARTAIGMPDLFKYLYFYTYLTQNDAGYTYVNPVELGMPWKSTGSNYAMYSSPGWNVKSNLDPGETISLEKSGDDYIWTFSDVDDYNDMKAEIAAYQASAMYTSWLGYTDTDSRYYAYYYLYYTIAENVGDTSGATKILTLFIGDDITYDDVNRKVTITCEVPVNNFPDPGDCNNVDTIVANAINSMTTTKNAANFSEHTHIRYNGMIYSAWPYYFENKPTYREFVYGWVIQDCFVDGIVDMAALGFCKGIIAGAYYTNVWFLPHYYDKVTFTDYSTHDKRLKAWKLERRMSLRTSICADSSYETVYESFPIDAPVASAGTGMDSDSFDANWSAVADADGYYLDVSTDPAFGTFVAGFEDLDVLNVLTYNVTGLDDGTLYYFRVRTYDGIYVSYSSNVITVVTDLVCTLTATVFDDSAIDLAWTLEDAVLDSIIVEQSENGTDYVEIDTIDGAEVTYQATGLDPNKHYWFRIKGVIGTTETTYSNADDDWTAMRISLTSQGAGTGVATLRFEVETTDVTMTIDGNGKFYTDSGGTLGEATSRTITAGALRIFYLKVTSGSCKILVFHKNNIVKWGNASGSLYGWISATNGPTISGTVAALARSFTHLFVYGSNTISGNVTDLPSGLVSYSMGGTNTITGDIANFPSTITYINLTGSNTIYGDLADLPASLLSLYIYGSSSSISGVAADIKEGIQGIVLQNSGTMSGDIGDLPSTLSTLLLNYNTVTGDLATLPAGMTYLNVGSGNTIYGDIDDLPVGMTYLRLTGNQTVSGSIANIPTTLTHLELTGNSVTGSLADIPSAMTYMQIQGTNTVSGIISDIPSSMITFNVTGSNTISGDVVDIPISVTAFNVYGSNTITGDVADIASPILNFFVAGSNTIYGNISDVHSAMRMFVVTGLNVITGDLADLPPSVYYYELSGLNTVSQYTSPTTLGFSGRCVHKPALGSGLSSTEVDNFLIDQSGHAWSSAATLDISGNNAARTSASDAAVATIAGYGTTVITN